MEQKRNYSEAKEPEISVRYLADFMGASERRRRSIVAGCKFRPIARLVQHREATAAISSALHDGVNPQALREKAEFIRNKLADDDFDINVNEANADYVDKFAEVYASIKLPNATILPGKKFPSFVINGVKVAFSPHLLLERIDKSNKRRRGAFMLRYAKNKKLSPKVGDYQSAAAFGIFSEFAVEPGLLADKTICVTLDAVTGKTYPAPGASASMFADMKAVCKTIAEWWPNIEPPE